MGTYTQTTRIKKLNSKCSILEILKKKKKKMEEKKKERKHTNLLTQQSSINLFFISGSVTTQLQTITLFYKSSTRIRWINPQTNTCNEMPLSRSLTHTHTHAHTERSHQSTDTILTWEPAADPFFRLSNYLCMCLLPVFTGFWCRRGQINSLGTRDK